MAELKPCPFCGGEANLMHDHAGSGYSYVMCGNCGLKSVSFIRSFDRASDLDAIKYWNGRAEDGK